MKIENMELGLKGWWNTVNKITGRDSKALNISSVINPVDINLFFQRISTDTQYSAPELLLFRKEMASPLLMCITSEDLWLLIVCRKILHTILLQLLLSFLTLHSDSNMQSVPLPRNLDNKSLIPKEFPLSSCAQLGSMSLTNIIMKLFETWPVCKQEILWSLSLWLVWISLLIACLLKVST